MAGLFAAGYCGRYLGQFPVRSSLKPQTERVFSGERARTHGLRFCSYVYIIPAFGRRRIE